jgi:hypothetical protein
LFSLSFQDVCHAVCFVLDDELLIVIDMDVGVLLIGLVFFFERLCEPRMLHISPDGKKLLNRHSAVFRNIYGDLLKFSSLAYAYVSVHSS